MKRGRGWRWGRRRRQWQVGCAIVWRRRRGGAICGRDLKQRALHVSFSKNPDFFSTLYLILMAPHFHFCLMTRNKKPTLTRHQEKSHTVRVVNLVSSRRRLYKQPTKPKKLDTTIAPKIFLFTKSVSLIAGMVCYLVLHKYREVDEKSEPSSEPPFAADTHFYAPADNTSTSITSRRRECCSRTMQKLDTLFCALLLYHANPCFKETVHIKQ